MTRHASYRREPQDVPARPYCHGKLMVLRFSRADGRAFYGCWAWPHCRNTAPANVTSPDFFGKGKAVPDAR